MNKRIVLLFIPLLLGCEEETPVPKPPLYLRLELPEHSYALSDESRWFRFSLGEQYDFQITEQTDSTEKSVIDLGPLNASIYLNYWRMGRPLSFYINNANDEVDRHKIKADKILDERILRPDDRVFGTFFELQGDVATPFQFYLTDSTDQFLYAEVLFNTRPNYDSLRPSLDYLSVDLQKMLESIQWEHP